MARPSMPTPQPFKRALHPGTQASRLRAALALGPLTANEMSLRTGVSVNIIAALLKGDVDAGRIFVHKDVKPWAYELVKAAS